MCPFDPLAAVAFVEATDRRQLAAMPKIDLHRHLEGSLRLATLAEIAAEHGRRLRGDDLQRLRPLVQFVDSPPDFLSFLARFDVLRRFFSTGAAIRRVAYEAVLDAAADGVRYLELRFSPLSLAQSQGFSLDGVTEWVIEGVDDAQEAAEIEVRLLLTIVRSCDARQAAGIVDLARDYRSSGVVGIDLAGDEMNYPAEPFAPMFHRACGLGLGTTVHAGEVTDAASVCSAVQLLEAQRIGHGVHARDDGAVVDLLRREHITLEMCPTSNLQTGAVTRMSTHPLREYYLDDLRVTVNTDNPSVSCTTLTDEYQILVNELHMTRSELTDLILNAAKAAFLPDDEKKELERWFQRVLTSSSPVGSVAAKLRLP
jgi:adenosine deaminase